VNYPYLCEDLSEGESILMADGRVELLVLEVREDYIRARVVNGGMIAANKGVNLPGSDLRIFVFTEKDREDLEFGLAEGELQPFVVAGKQIDRTGLLPLLMVFLIIAAFVFFN